MFENCMRELRHQETRVTANQVVKAVKAYLTLVHKKLLSGFERPGIQLGTVIPVNADAIKSESR